MDNHPIPQDVTGFQFKLVGSMTIKQFVYVAGGILIAVVFYYLPITAFIKFPLIFISVLSGLAIAFLPLEGRPMDVMVAKFIKALFKPNQFFYKKSGGQLSFSTLDLKPIRVDAQIAKQTGATEGVRSPSQEKEKQLESLLSTMESSMQSPLDKKENELLSSFFTNSPQPQQAPVTYKSIHTVPQEAKQVTRNDQLPPQSQNKLNSPSVPLMPQVSVQQNQPAPIQTTTMRANIPPAPSINKAAQPQPQPQPQPTVAPTYVQVPKPAQQKPVAPKPSAADFPNLIMGTVKDSRGNVLPGILVEVKNAAGESVRAFKTNALGQFASATQLPKGIYILTFEDPKGQHTFSALQVNVNDTIQPAYEVTSIDAREELRRSLFG